MQAPAGAPARGFTLIELLIVVAIIGVIAAIAVPALLRARITANEGSAIGSLRTLRTAQVVFQTVCGGDKDYAATLPQLAAARTLSPDIGSGLSVIKSGYVFTLTPTAAGLTTDKCTGQPTAQTWYAQAAPMMLGTSGSRGFATNQDDSIWQDTTGVPPVEPFTLGGTVSPIR